VAAEDKKRAQQLRAFNARQVLHAHVAKRRGRDQLVWSFAAVVAVVLSSLSLWAYQTIGPGGPPTVADASVSENREWEGDISLDKAQLGITLDGEQAPQAVANFITLATDGFYDTLTCHRLTTEGLFVLQSRRPPWGWLWWSRILLWARGERPRQMAFYPRREQLRWRGPPVTATVWEVSSSWFTRTA